MKAWIRIITICLIVLLLPMTSLAATATVSITGPSIIRAGDIVKIAVMINGTNLRAVQGQIVYDTSQLTYQSSGGVLAGWAIEINGATAGKVTFLGVDDKMAAPINSSKQLFTLTFQVKSSVATGANVGVTATKLSASDGTHDFTPGDAVYSKTVAAPASSNNTLATLTVSNAEISPAFSAATTSYTASVPFATSKLSITATAADSKAKVVVDNKTLVAGGKTEVNITVTAENGTKKVYTITVTREKDPNYIASTVSTLSDMKVEGFLLSPPFNNADMTYKVWLPTEVEEIKILATATDGKASIEVTGGNGLVAGQDNVLTVICTAEDGTSKTEYTIVAWRAPAHDAQSSTPTPEPTSVEATPELSATPTVVPTSGEEQGPESDSTPVLPIVGAGALGVVVGLGGSMFIKRRK